MGNTFNRNNEMREHKNEIDFSIFSQKQTQCNSTVNDCQCIIRIINGIKYYQTLNETEIDNNKFIIYKRNIFIIN